MVHPAITAVSIGIGIGAFIWFLFTSGNENRQHQQHQHHEERPSQNQTHTEYVYYVMQKHNNSYDKFNNLFDILFAEMNVIYAAVLEAFVEAY